MTFGTHERGPMRISTDPTSGLSVAQRRVLQAFYAGGLTAGKLMQELRCAAAGQTRLTLRSRKHLPKWDADASRC